MIDCKKIIIIAMLMITIPLTSWSEAAVVDDSDNFAMMDEQRARDASLAHSKYDDSNAYEAKDAEEPALAKDDAPINPNKNLLNNASLIDTVHTLQQEIQELRGQLEVQAHDLKLLQQQQMAFYKDLDARIGGKAVATATITPVTSSSLSGETDDKSAKVIVSGTSSSIQTNIPITASRTNPAEEQISYLAAYELVKNRRYDDALDAMTVFVQKYPRGGYTANAQYWLGELFLVKKDYSKAVDHFALVLQQFPTSPKSAASMLKVGYAYAAMGNKPEAKKYLQQVVRAYPNTPTAQLANSKLQTI